MRAESLARAVNFKAALLLLLLSSALTACAANPPRKIALLAPFEGQFREVGYNALYAVRLAFADTEPNNIQLMAVDDGGGRESAIARIRALNIDPAVAAIIALGPAATHPDAQTANDKPLIMIGNWGHDRSDEHSLYAANSALASAHSSGDLLMLFQTLDLGQNLESVPFYSSGSPPDAAFRERYVNSALYAPPPNLLATLTYDIARLALSALENEQ